MKRKTWYFAAAALIALLILASIPRLGHVMTVDSTKMDNYPVIRDAYTQLCAEYSAFDIVAEDTIYVATVSNLWGSWERYVLPCYSVHLPVVPTAGSVDSHAALYVLAPWSEENVFTGLFRLKVRDFSLYLEPGENLYLYERAELTHANLAPTRYIVEPRLISSSEAIICGDLPTIWVDYAMATNNSATDRNQPTITSFTWNYSLRFMGKKIRTGEYIIEKEHLINA